MTEWELIVDSDNLPPPQPEKPVRSRSYQRWYLIILAILALLTVGAVTIYRQRVERQAAIRADLTDFIYEEETVRSFGRQEQATEFIVSAASPDWQRRYEQAFTPADIQSPPAFIQLDEVNFDGQCALVIVDLDGYTQVRTYCLTNQQWRRAPVTGESWGDEPIVVNLPNEIRLVFRPRDQTFATALASDLPQLFEKLKQWRGQQVGTNAPQAEAVEKIDIVIEPYDLDTPLISDEGQRIVLNSPLLVPFTGDGLPSAQDSVRLALVKALLSRAGLTPVETNLALPGAVRFVEAAQTVIALELMFSPKTREQLSNTWRVQADGEWITPFFADLLPATTAATTRQARSAAYITAAYINHSAGLDTLVTILRQLPGTTSWDSLFETILNRPTVVLEQEAIAYAKEGDATAATILPGTTTVDSLPLQASLLGIKNQETGGLTASVAVPGATGPVLVEMSPDLSFQTTDGGPLPAECLPAGTNLEIDGGWLEVQRRLQASRVTVQEVTPLSLAPAPPDTVAFLIAGESPTEPDLTAASVFPSNRPYLAAGELLLPRALVAVRQDGTSQTLAPLSRTQRVVSLPVPAGKKVGFLFIVDLPTCDRSWFVHYDPWQGITGQWLGPPPPLKWVWRSDQQDLLLLDSRPGGAGHTIFETGDDLSIEPVSQINTLVSVAGWNQETGQIVFVKRAWQGATGIGLLDPESGAMRRAKVYVYPLRARRLSPDGNWLAYLTGVRNRFDPPYRLELLNLETLTESPLVQVGDDEAIGPAVWSSYLAEPRVAMLAGPLAEDGLLWPTRILVASPEQPGRYEVAVEGTEGEGLTGPVFCADGGLLYRADEDGQYRLMRQSPGRSAELLFSSDQPFRPLACP